MILRSITVCILVAASLPVGTAQAADPYGVWMRGDGNARVEIAPCGTELCATNLWVGDTSKGEEVGDVLIMSLERTSDTVFSGTAFDPKRDKTFSMTLTIEENGLATRGCIIAGLFCRDVTWTPVE